MEDATKMRGSPGGATQRLGVTKKGQQPQPFPEGPVTAASAELLRGTIARRRALRLLASGALGGLLIHAGVKAGAAQERAPSKHGATQRENPMAEGRVQYVHPEKVYGYLPGLSSAAALASLYSLDVETYQAITRRFDTNARQAAHELLADPTFGARVDRLPFQPGTTVVGVGESDMDDLQSWLEILRHLLELRRPQDQIRVVNDGVSGQTTTQALRRLVPVLEQQPAWIICALGANDVVRYGVQPIKTQVSPEETARNFAGLRHLAATRTTARWVWVTRWVADEARVAAYPAFRQAQFALRNEDFGAVSDIILQQADPVDPVVDLRAAIGYPPDPALLEPDGLHPSLAGHRAIARALVERLAS
jgi:acyl-CoA thioesterase-1